MRVWSGISTYAWNMTGKLILNIQTFVYCGLTQTPLAACAKILSRSSRASLSEGDAWTEIRKTNADWFRVKGKI